LRETETLSDRGKVVHICELEVEKNLNDEERRSIRDVVEL
jgi:hypothetical protein